MEMIRRYIHDGSVWVLWVVGDSPQRGLFTPRLFTTLRSLKQFVDRIEDCEVRWEHKNDPNNAGVVLSASAPSGIATGARWKAARSPTPPEPPEWDPFMPPSLQNPPYVITGD